MVNFLYPRSIAITRQNQDAAVGAQPYSGVTQANESTIATGIAAKIQADKGGAAPVAKLVADAAGESVWKIIFRLPLGTVQSRDIITDDLGNRYQVISADWGSLVTTCRAQLLET